MSNSPALLDARKRSKNTIRTKLAVAALATCVATSAANAEDHLPAAQLLQIQFIEEVGGAERINFAGKLRMLSQRIAATACYDHGGIEVEASSSMLHAATAEFTLIAHALEHGDESIGIVGEESKRRTLMYIAALHEEWDPMIGAITDIVETGGTDEELVYVARHSEALLDVAKELVSQISTQYADPTSLLQSDALVIDIAGRQRMLAQRISKDACLIATGLEKEHALDDIVKTMQMYDVSANALYLGMPDAGISAPANDEIAAGLGKVVADWNEIKPVLERIATDGASSTEEMSLVFATMNGLTGQMNALVGEMAAESKLGL